MPANYFLNPSCGFCGIKLPHARIASRASLVVGMWHTSESEAASGQET
jgi:hypothetical protein